MNKEADLYVLAHQGGAHCHDFTPLASYIWIGAWWFVHQSHKVWNYNYICEINEIK